MNFKKLIRSHFKIIFLFSTLCLITLSILSFVRIQNLIEASELVTHTHKVKLELELVFQEIVQAESAQRGYIHSKDSVFLEQFYSAHNNVKGHYDKIGYLIKDNPSQQLHFTALRAAVDERLLYLNRVANIASISTISSHTLLEGKVLMDKVRNLVNKMESEEEQVLEQRTALLHKETFITPLFTILLVLGAVLIIIMAYLKITQELKISSTLKTAIEERENRIQQIFKAAPDAIVTIDHEGIITNWNAEAENMFGWKKNEVLGQTLTQTIIPERYRQQHINGMKHFFKSGEGPLFNKPIEIYALKKDNYEFPVELKISVSKMFDQRPVFIGFLRDITTRKQIEMTLKNQTNQLIEAQQLAHIGSWEWDVALNKIEWSDELYRIYGLTPQEFEANYENYLRYIHPDDLESVNGTVQQAFKDQLPFSFIHKLVRADGIVRTVSSTGKVFTDSNGNTVRMSGTAQDITEQKEYETKLQKSEERFIKIFDNNPVAMTLAEVKSNKIRYVNNTFCTVFGYSREEIIGHTSEEMNLIGPEEYERVVTVILDSLQEKRTLAELQALSEEKTEELLIKLNKTDTMKDLEVLYNRKNGNTFSALVSYEVISFQTESFTITSYQDITERKKAEVQLKNQNQELEKLNKELESFAYISSHDLQEPIRKIQTFISRIIADEHQNLSDKGKNYIDRIQYAAMQMETLMKDLIAYSRTNTGERKFEKVHLNKIVEEVKEGYRDELNENHGIIEATEMCEANIIPFQFRQLLNNLIGNAIKFSEPNKPPYIKIKSTVKKYSELNNSDLQAGKDYCHVTVTDNGIGFAPQYKDRIFEMFQRLNSKTEYKGTGMGLAIVKKIVENHMGIITATSELNKGAKFDIYIPA